MATTDRLSSIPTSLSELKDEHQPSEAESKVAHVNSKYTNSEIKSTRYKIDDPPLIRAAYKGDIAALQVLVEDGDVDPVVLKDQYGQTVIDRIAGHTDDVEMAKLIMDSISDEANKLELINYQNDQDGRTAVMRAAWNNHPLVLDYLLENGAEIHVKNHRGDDALRYAMFAGNDECVRILKEHGAKEHNCCVVQ